MCLISLGSFVRDHSTKSVACAPSLLPGICLINNALLGRVHRDKSSPWQHNGVRFCVCCRCNQNHLRLICAVGMERVNRPFLGRGRVKNVYTKRWSCVISCNARRKRETWLCAMQYTQLVCYLVAKGC